MAPEDFPLWLALVIYAVMAFQTWLFVLWAMRWWDKGIAALRRRQDRERDDTDRR